MGNYEMKEKPNLDSSRSENEKKPNLNSSVSGNEKKPNLDSKSVGSTYKVVKDTVEIIQFGYQCVGFFNFTFAYDVIRWLYSDLVMV
jgi:hypothetical protein